MKKRKNILYFSLILLISVLIIFLLSFSTYKSVVTVGGKSFVVDVADTRYLLEKGLSGHSPLFNDEGMLFIFKKPDAYGFWMKDMLFPIDIIWFDENLKIVHIEKSVQPESYPKIYYPASPAMFVLEISPG